MSGEYAEVCEWRQFEFGWALGTHIPRGPVMSSLSVFILIITWRISPNNISEQ